MKEAEVLNRVTATALALGWSCWHVPAPMRWTEKGWVGAKSGAGLPDLVLVHDDPPRLIFAELKGTAGKLRPAQLEFLQAAKKVADHGFDLAVGDGSPLAAPLGVYVVTPETEDTFTQILRTKILS